MDAKATDSFRDRNLSANYSCGLLRLRLESDWSQNNKHSRNNFRRSWFNGFHCNVSVTSRAKNSDHLSTSYTEVPDRGTYKAERPLKLSHLQFFWLSTEQTKVNINI